MTKIPGQKDKGLFSAIMKAGLLAGAIDICLAFLYSYLKRGTAPQAILQYIAKVAFGKNAINDPTLLTITGLLVHFAIAMCWTKLFFMIYRALKLKYINWLVTAVIYGVFVWAIMSMVLLPFWNDKPYVFNAEAAAVNAIILIIAIGLPVSFFAKRYYGGR